MNTTQPYLIISAFQLDQTHVENLQSHVEMVDLLRQIDVVGTEVEGQFCGVAELSYLVPWSYRAERAACKLAADLGQSSILVIDANRYGYLVDPGGNVTDELGQYKIQDTEPMGDWTLLVNGGYLHFPDLENY